MRDSNTVDAVFHHLREIALDGGEVVIFVPVRVRPEGSVGHAAHIELAIADEEKLPSDGRTCSVRRAD